MVILDSPWCLNTNRATEGTKVTGMRKGVGAIDLVHDYVPGQKQ